MGTSDRIEARWWTVTLIVGTVLIAGIFILAIIMEHSAMAYPSESKWPHRVLKMQHEVVVPASLLEAPRVLEETARRICESYDMVTPDGRAHLRKRSDGICFAAGDESCETWVLVFECHVKKE